MFTEQELVMLAGCCFREGEFLKAVEGCGVPTILEQGKVMALRVKCLELAQAARKAAQGSAGVASEGATDERGRNL